MAVVFPAPLGPRKPCTSPADTVRSRSSSARVVPKSFTSPDTEIAAVMSLTSSGSRASDTDSGLHPALIDPGHSSCFHPRRGPPTSIPDGQGPRTNVAATWRAQRRPPARTGRAERPWPAPRVATRLRIEPGRRCRTYMAWSAGRRWYRPVTCTWRSHGWTAHRGPAVSAQAHSARRAAFLLRGGGTGDPDRAPDPGGARRAGVRPPADRAQQPRGRGAPGAGRDLRRGPGGGAGRGRGGLLSARRRAVGRGRGAAPGAGRRRCDLPAGVEGACRVAPVRPRRAHHPAG